VPFLHGYDLTEAATEGVDFVAIMLLAAAGELPRRGQVEMMNGGQLHAEHRDNHTGVGQTAQRGHARGGPGARQGPHHGRRAVVRRCLGHHGVVPGYGHLMHTEGDLRAPLLFGLARSHGVAELERRCGRPIPLNATGAIAAVLSDLGLLWRFGRALVGVARSVTPGALALDEVDRERRWRIVASGPDVAYGGHPPRPLPEQWGR
jgi:citrate synthase